MFAADKTSPGAWNLPLYKIFCDPFNTAGLIIDKGMHDGFTIEVHDLIEHKRAFFSCPEDLYDLLVYIGDNGAVRDQARVPGAQTPTSRSRQLPPRGCR